MRLISAARDALMLRLANIEVYKGLVPDIHNKIGFGDDHEKILL